MGASCCANRDRPAGLTSLDTVDCEAMRQALEHSGSREAHTGAAETLAATPDEPPVVLIDEHYPVTTTAQAAYNTFSQDVADTEAALLSSGKGHSLRSLFGQRVAP
jgi:hypothetical protein